MPLDATEEARAALPVAAGLAERVGASLLLLEMVRTADARLGLAADVVSGALTDRTVFSAEVTAREQVVESYIAAVAEELAQQGLDVSYAVGTGSESAGIVEAARRENVDLIVMATHARSALGRLVFGSVTDHVIRHAHVPVLAIPPGAHAGKEEG